MENASKALLMAGGILIAILIIGALLLMVTQIGDYQRTKDSGAKSSQIAKFNSDFERYLDDKGIKGTDIVSLINKIQDYNNSQVNNTKGNSGTTNYVDYNIKMSITISGLDKFNGKYFFGNDNIKLFSKDFYKIGFDDNGKIMGNKIFEELNQFISGEQNTSIGEMKQLSSIYMNAKSDDEAIEAIKEKLGDDSWNGTASPTLDSIKKYSQYSEFKTSKFIVDKEPIYEKRTNKRVIL